MKIKTFTFNPFQENTYILYDDTKECIIVDPGCYTIEEQNTLSEFIKQKQLIPLQLYYQNVNQSLTISNQNQTDVGTGRNIGRFIF